MNGNTIAVYLRQSHLPAKGNDRPAPPSCRLTCGLCGRVCACVCVCDRVIARVHLLVWQVGQGHPRRAAARIVGACASASGWVRTDPAAWTCCVRQSLRIDTHDPRAPFSELGVHLGEVICSRAFALHAVNRWRARSARGVRVCMHLRCVHVTNSMRSWRRGARWHRPGSPRSSSQRCCPAVPGVRNPTLSVLDPPAGPMLHGGHLQHVHLPSCATVSTKYSTILN